MENQRNAYATVIAINVHLTLLESVYLCFRNIQLPTFPTLITPSLLQDLNEKTVGIDCMMH
jgi:hypothetical protein